MKKGRTYICLGLILILVISIGLVYQRHSTKEELKSDTNGLLSFYVEKENNVYEQTVRKYWPTEGYVLNEVKSNCENGSVLTWINNKVQVTGNMSDKCYIYFDKIVKDYAYTENRLETGESYDFVAPATGNYKIELWGASGGTTETGAAGGKGAYVSGNLKLEKGLKLYLYIGEGGKTVKKLEPIYAIQTFNGGGSGNQNIYTNISSGGGATDIRLTNGEWNLFISLKSRIMIAAGGGGGAYWGNIGNGAGGYAGGLIGGEGKILFTAYPSGGEDNRILDNSTGGTQISGGLTNNKLYTANGLFGIGGSSQGLNGPTVGSGGGGGYYGGGAGYDQGWSTSAGAGGSSFISGHDGCLAIDKNSLEENINLKSGCTEDSKTIECSIHYSNYKFENTEMIDGLGYKWTIEAGEQTGMPSPSGEIEMGHDGNGYARITYLGK